MTDALTKKHTNEQKIDKTKALKLRLQGVSLPDIGKIYGISKQSVYSALKPFMDILKPDVDISLYRANRAELLEAIELNILSHLSDSDRLKKASVNNLAYAYQQISNNRRLERGESTNNVSFQGVIREIRDSLEAKKTRLADLGVDI